MYNIRTECHSNIPHSSRVLYVYLCPDRNGKNVPVIQLIVLVVKEKRGRREDLKERWGGGRGLLQLLGGLFEEGELIGKLAKQNARGILETKIILPSFLCHSSCLVSVTPESGLVRKSSHLCFNICF